MLHPVDSHCIPHYPSTIHLFHYMSLLYSALNSGTISLSSSSRLSEFSSCGLLSSIVNLTNDFIIMCLVSWDAWADLDEITTLSRLKALWREKGLLRDLINEMWSENPISLANSLCQTSAVKLTTFASQLGSGRHIISQKDSKGIMKRYSLILAVIVQLALAQLTSMW